MTQKIIFPNFWQAVLIIACCATTHTVIYFLTALLSKAFDYSILTQSIQVIAVVLNYTIYIAYLAKKTKINILDYYALPNIITLFKLIVVSFLLKFIITIPLYQVNDFYKLLFDSKIMLIGSSIYTKAPVIVIVLWWILIPLAEEILYRGLILNQFLKQYTPIKAILLSSLIFSFSHLSLADFAGHFVVGIVLGIFYYKTNSILVSSISHIFLTSYILHLEIFELNTSVLVIFTFLFLVSILFVTIILRKPMNTVKIKDLTLRK